MSIVLDQLSKSYGGRTLFDEVSITFNPGNRYGLTGPNGSGKSTLLKMIMGFIEPNRGTISLPSKVGILRQNIEDFKNYTVLDTVLMGNQRLWQALRERDELYEKEITDAVGMRLGALEEIIADEDGYTAESAAEHLLISASIPQELHPLKMGTIPLDLQFRTLLCQSLFGNPTALLLDEPTNHLDLESIGWLENFLKEYTGTVIVVSHNRHFLNAVTTHTVDIDYGTILLYPGNYDQMVEAKTLVREQAEATAKTNEKKIQQLKEYIARFGAGTRASQVQSRYKELARLQPAEQKQSNIQRPYIRFPRPEKQAGKLVCKLDRVSKSYEGKEVIKNFSLEIYRDDKIGVIGNNGRGKTTLIKLIAGILQPDTGTVERGDLTQQSYFPQNHSELILSNEKRTAFDWLRDRKQGLYDKDIRSSLGKMLFGGDDAFKSVATLSGGESARLILAGMMLEDHNFIILDEPNNHLDLEAVSALGWALNDYKGTAVVVSHDRDLIDQFATKIIAFEEKGIRIFYGNLEAYLQSRT